MNISHIFYRKYSFYKPKQKQLINMKLHSIIFMTYVHHIAQLKKNYHLKTFNIHQFMVKKNTA